MPNRRAVAVVFALAWLAHACRPGWSQIVVPERVELGQPIVAECQATAPEGGLIAFKWRGDAKFRRIGSGAKAHVWATAGDHAIECIVATYRPERSIVVEKDGKPTEAQPPLLAVKVYKAKFSVGPPKPPEPPKPLNELVDAKTADDLAVWLTAFSHAIVSQRWETGGVVREALADQAEKYGKTNNAAWPVIWGRVEKVTPDGPLDRLKVLAEFDAIVKELGGGPGPDPPQPPGPTADKLWLVAISRTEDRTVSQAALLTSPTVRASLGAHRLVSIDKEQAEARKYDKYAGQIPCVIVMDAATNKVLGVEIIPPTVDDAWLVGVAAKYGRKP